jgi:large subunit ribosomal protein L30
LLKKDSAQKDSEEFQSMATKNAIAKIKLQYFRSKICTPVKHKLVVKGLGFTRLNQIVEREDTPSIRGMVAKIPHLVRVVE